MALVTAEISSPVGTWFAVADETPEATTSAPARAPVLRLCMLLTTDHSRERALERLEPTERESIAGTADDGHEVVRALTAYVAGDIAALNSLVCEQPGGAFRQRVWRAMRTIAEGSTASYAQLAVQAGNPAAARAAGSACAMNRIALVVPCHRVVRTDGSLGHYYFGVQVKQWLLRHEHALATPHEKVEHEV